MKRQWGVWGLAAVFVGAGALHLLRPSVFDSIVPRWVAPGVFPSARSVTLLSGVAELAGGLGLLFPRSRRAAGWGLAALLVAVFPANVEMARTPERFGLPAWVLWVRLPLQPLLVWWALWAGQGGWRQGAGRVSRGRSGPA
ncbi:DoxX family protein [Deinococcus aquiradiocola]|uniref:DoxX family membrane protein n=1 Tax=Deinococcus aquiradiocola TaxID=393059 RepID=A0A917P678_9DEIO|nr:hypothetical protein [Deinococcus aquiradiocola]GGJ63711.1 hypothetical protein GCM10008939_04460 [Deinococcus aquiradiocola]